MINIINKGEYITSSVTKYKYQYAFVLTIISDEPKLKKNNEKAIKNIVMWIFKRLLCIYIATPRVE